MRALAEAAALVWLGGGCVRSGAEDAVKALVEHLGAPVVTTLNGRRALPTDHPLAVGRATFYPPFRRLLDEANLVLAVGTRFQAVATGFWSLPLGKRLVQIDVDASMISRNYPATAGVIGDAALALDALRAAISGVSWRRRRSRIRRAGPRGSRRIDC